MLHNSEKIKAEYELQQIQEELYIIKLLINIEKKRVLDNIELRAMAGSLHLIYNGIEKILLFSVSDFNPKGSGWHSELLKLCMNQEIISKELKN